RRPGRSAVRHGNDRRQERSEVLVTTDRQPFDGAVLPFGHEQHVEQAENSPPAETIHLSQDPVLGTGVTTEAQGDHLERCGHRCLLFRPVMPPTVPPGGITASRCIRTSPGTKWVSLRNSLYRP